jgi:hypothetical protein
MTPEISPAAPVVEVIYPRATPHYAPIAAEIQATTRRQLEALPPAELERFMQFAAEITRDRNEYARFRNRLGIQPGD